MRPWRSVMLVLLLACAAHAQSKSDPEGFGKRTMELFEAMKAQNVAALDAILAPNAVFTSFAGTTGTKAQYLDIFARKLMVIEDYKLVPIGVEMYGDAAVVVYRYSIKAHVGDQAWPPQLVSTDTWVKQKGTWRLAARHGTAIAGAH